MKTKEQLIEEVATLNHENDRLLTQDQIVRREFAKAFGMNKGSESHLAHPSLPSWEQVWVHLGILLGREDTTELYARMDDLEDKIRKEIHPNI